MLLLKIRSIKMFKPNRTQIYATKKILEKIIDVILFQNLINAFEYKLVNDDEMKLVKRVSSCAFDVG